MSEELKLEVICQNLVFEGKEHIGRIRSSERVQRGFCTKCGSSLFYHLIEDIDYQIPVGLYVEQSKSQMSMQVFIDEKPELYEFANKTQIINSQEIFAKFGPTSN